MGHLFIINESLELSAIQEANRDSVFIDFCAAVDAARKDKDLFYATNDIHERVYSYGRFYYDFLYAEWDKIKANEFLRGISSTTVNLYHSIAMAIPGFVLPVLSREEFEQHYGTMHFGNSGFEMQNPPLPFIYSHLSWQKWKQSWYRNNQNQIPWPLNADRFLPNKRESDKILFEEIKKHKKESELREKHDGNIGLAFHEEIMRHKGPQIEAYTIEIGSKIVKANYYNKDEALTIAEQRHANSLRNIYSILNKEGNIQYISFDHRHGMFEYHSSDGTHLGEYKFDGSFNSKAEATHNFKTL